MAQEPSYTDDVLNSCVLFARLISPFDFHWVASAKDLHPLGKAPVVGGIVVFRAGKIFGKDGHMATILRNNTASSTLDVVEANYKKGAITVRTISKWDKEILGFFP